MTVSNPRATKQDGTWCKTEYPVTAWADPALRVVLPGSLQVALAVESPRLRQPSRRPEWQRSCDAGRMARHEPYARCHPWHSCGSRRVPAESIGGIMVFLHLCLDSVTELVVLGDGVCTAISAGQMRDTPPTAVARFAWCDVRSGTVARECRRTRRRPGGCASGHGRVPNDGEYVAIRPVP
jgi:hypothetical protein